jgi:RNA polymerase sigma-70 factor (ECF subfamily)
VNSVDAERWVREAQQGSVAAFERLYRAYVDRIYGLCLRLMANCSDAEDCVQNTFLNAWRRIDQFGGRSDFGTWLHRIAVNEALMAKRRNPLVPDAPVEHEPPATAPSPNTALDLDAAIAELPHQARHVFVLRAMYGYSHDEIAELLALASGTVRAHYHHARRALQQRLGLEDNDD